MSKWSMNAQAYSICTPLFCTQGGAMFVATSYAFVYGRTPPRIYAYFESKFQVHAYGAGNESQHRKEVGKEG